MPIATAEQYAAMLDGAASGGYALAGVNVTSSQTLNAGLQGFAEAGSDGILQVSTGGGEYASGAAKDMVAGARALAAFAREIGERCPVLVGLHTDHCPPDKLDDFLRPLLAESLERHHRGEEALFHSQMFDRSALPLEENLTIASELLEQCAGANVVLEIECGVVGGEEDGARFQYVFHGGSGSEPQEIRKAVSYGVVKMNIDTDTQYAFTRAVAGHMFASYDGVLKIDGRVGD